MFILSAFSKPKKLKPRNKLLEQIYFTAGKKIIEKFCYVPMHIEISFTIIFSFSLQVTDSGYHNDYECICMRWTDQKVNFSKFW